MRVRDRFYVVSESAKRLVFGRPRRASMTDLTLSRADHAAEAAGDGGELHRIFYDHSGRVAHKWTHFLDTYERHFAPWRGKPVRMLEIGVSRGGSLEIWRKYFGPDAVLFGIDINPACADRVDPPSVVRIGSQADPAFLRDVVREMGGLDIVLDDGSHVATHQRISFEVLFPLLADGGLYLIEDLDTSYWPSYEGGYRRPGTGIEFIKRMVDDMHAWYHSEPTRTPARDWIAAIHVYDSICVIEKKRRRRPAHTTVPS